MKGLIFAWAASMDPGIRGRQSEWEAMLSVVGVSVEAECAVIHVAGAEAREPQHYSCESWGLRVLL